MRVTWQIGVTSMNALGGAVCDDYGVCHRARGFRLEGSLPAKSGLRVSTELGAQANKNPVNFNLWG